MDAYREMARAAVRATRQRGDVAMTRYFGHVALALAGRIRMLRQMAALQMSPLYKSPQARANFFDPTMAVPGAVPGAVPLGAVPLGRTRPWGGAPQPIAEVARRSAMAASAAALGHLVPDTGSIGASIGKTPASPAWLRQPWRVAAASPRQGTRTTTGNAASGAPIPLFRGLTINPDGRARANNTPAAGNSYPDTRVIARRLIPAIRAMSAVSAHARTEAVQTPGFGQTVRPPAAGPTAGDVYLDKALVGYHLAAAITAEQTRAAGRPNIAGAGFNSSMAALRPAGTGL